MKRSFPLLFLLAGLPFAVLADSSDPIDLPLVVSLSPPAQDTVRQSRTIIGTHFARENLSDGLPDWTESGISVRHDIATRHLFEFAAVETERFDLDDTQFNALYSFPINAKLTATIDGNTSPTHRVLPKNMLGGTLQYEFARAWLFHGGARTTRYDDVRVNQGVLMLEHYFSSYSWLLGWRPTRAFDTTAHVIEARGTYYYGDKSSVTLLASDGKEASSIGTDVVLTKVNAVALIGHHWLNNRWAINYAASYTRQGDLYERSGIDIGVQYNF